MLIFVCLLLVLCLRPVPAMAGGGGGKKQSAPPPPPAPAPIPDVAEQEPEAKAVRDDEARKLRQRKGMSGTVLTSGLGDVGDDGGGLGKGLLGKSGM